MELNADPQPPKRRKETKITNFFSGSTGFNAETTKDATALVTKFEFIITLYIVGYIMGYMKQLSVVLQGRQQDIACGYKHIKLIEAQLQKVL